MMNLGDLVYILLECTWILPSAGLALGRGILIFPCSPLSLARGDCSELPC